MGEEENKMIFETADEIDERFSANRRRSDVIYESSSVVKTR